MACLRLAAIFCAGRHKFVVNRVEARGTKRLCPDSPTTPSRAERYALVASNQHISKPQSGVQNRVSGEDIVAYGKAGRAAAAIGESSTTIIRLPLGKRINHTRFMRTANAVRWMI
jgi:hypothetical protein